MSFQNVNSDKLSITISAVQNWQLTDYLNQMSIKDKQMWKSVQL